MNSIYHVVVINDPGKQLLSELQADAVNTYNCDGVLEYSLDEGQVDQLFQKEALTSGGVISDEMINKLELNKHKSGSFFKFFFYIEDAKKRASSFCNYLNENFPHLQAGILEEESMDWIETWKTNYRPIQVHNDLVVKPDWEYHGFDEKNIYIKPGMGFGTGGHETTHLCLEYLLDLTKHLEKGINCLDFGCGSGILGIAAIKKLEAIVDFLDIEKEALDNCLENISLNFKDCKSPVQGHSLIIRNRFKLVKKYDLVFANILENVLELESEIISISVNSNGYLVLSGILNDQVEKILEIYKNSFQKISTKSKGEWSAILMRKI